jgi:aminoglycoside 6'-N-acetyltransferase I
VTLAYHLLGPGDAPLLDRVAEDVFDETVHPRRARTFLAEPGHLLLVAREGGVVVGQCAAVIHRHVDRDADLFVENLGVAPAWRRQGIGAGLMRRMLAEARARGCAEAWVGTEPDNAAANALYRSLGGAAPEPFLLHLVDLGEVA